MDEQRHRFSWLMRRTALPVTTLALAFVIGASALTLGNLSARAQTATPATGTGPATVQVTGEGTVTMTPDTASISIGVESVKPTLAAAQTDANQKMTAVINTIKAAGIADKDIQTTNYSVNVIQNNNNSNGTPAAITGFDVSNTVVVTVRDLSKIGSLLDDVVAQGANTIYGINFYVNDPSKAASQARTQAVQDAQQKAAEYAAALGMTVGRVISVTESSSPSPQPRAMAVAAPSAASVPIQTGSQQISVTVDIVLALQP